MPAPMNATFASPRLLLALTLLAAGCADPDTGGAPGASSSSSGAPSSSSGAPGAPSSSRGAPAASITSPPSQGCTHDCIEADVELSDGSTFHAVRAALTATAPSLHRVAIGSIQGDGELGLDLAFDVTITKLNTPVMVAASAKDGPTFLVDDHAVDGSGKELPLLTGTGGQVVLSALAETSGSAIDGTFTGIVASRPGSSGVVKVTNGVFHGVVP